ncbi:MAG: sterol desaturase family protein [Pseudomonadota bacterium]|nr:sterol desaturase family protein [Pseudomonadota bacterium]
MASALLLSALAMTLIVALRYVITSGLFAAWTARRYPGRLAMQRPQMWSEFRWSLASAAIYGVPAGLVAWAWQERGWTRIYSDAAAYPRWWMPASVLAFLLIHDTYFYWTHRLMHRPSWYKRMHAVHHASRPPTAWAAMSFHPWEAVSGALVVPLLVFLIPIHAAMLGLVLAIMTLMGVTNHMGWEMFPRGVVHGKLGKWLITASHHQLHHHKYRCNYGLYFRHWDRLCGTDRGLGEFGVAPPATDAGGGW